jgi:hypothetical protein
MENKVEIKEDTQDDGPPPLPNEQQLEQKSDLNKKNPPKKPLPDIKILKQDGGLTSNAKTKKLRKTLKTKLNIKNETIDDLEKQIEHEDQVYLERVQAGRENFRKYLISNVSELTDDSTPEEVDTAMSKLSEQDKANLDAEEIKLAEKIKSLEASKVKNIEQLRNRISNMKAVKKKKTKAIAKTTASSSSASSTTTTTTTPPSTPPSTPSLTPPTPPTLSGDASKSPSPEREEEEQEDEKEEKEANSKKRIQTPNKITDTSEDKIKQIQFTINTTDGIDKLKQELNGKIGQRSLFTSNEIGAYLQKIGIPLTGLSKKAERIEKLLQYAKSLEKKETIDTDNSNSLEVLSISNKTSN